MKTVPVSWRKSSHSAQETDCVEVAGTLGAVRDTKNPQVTLAVDVRALVSAVRSGRLG
jgi:Domain of unknown function (DUF397)